MPSRFAPPMMSARYAFRAPFTPSRRAIHPFFTLLYAARSALMSDSEERGNARGYAMSASGICGGSGAAMRGR